MNISELINPEVVRSLLAGRYPAPSEPIKCCPKLAQWRERNIAKGLTANGKPRKRGPYLNLSGFTEAEKIERRRIQSSYRNRQLRKKKAYAVV